MQEKSQAGDYYTSTKRLTAEVGKIIGRQIPMIRIMPKNKVLSEIEKGKPHKAVAEQKVSLQELFAM
ncbi:MAG: hypothetical protein EOP48_24070, partial [Sphingobacteriales bacterium]